MMKDHLQGIVTLCFDLLLPTDLKNWDFKKKKKKKEGIWRSSGEKHKLQATIMVADIITA